jgi:hypothetical protein
MSAFFTGFRTLFVGMKLGDVSAMAVEPDEALAADVAVVLLQFLNKKTLSSGRLRHKTKTNYGRN